VTPITRRDGTSGSNAKRAEARAKLIKVNVAKWLKDAQLVSADPHTFSYLPKAPLTSTSVEAQTFPIEKTQSSRTTHVRSGT
jgi:hypothetical protein